MDTLFMTADEVARRADRLERNLTLVKEQKDEAVTKIAAANAERDEAFSIAEARTERVKEAQETIDRLEKEVTQASYAIKQAEEKLDKMQKLEAELTEKKNECLEKDKKIIQQYFRGKYSSEDVEQDVFFLTVCDWNDPYYKSPSLWVCSEGLFVVIGGDKLEFGSDIRCSTTTFMLSRCRW